MQGDRQDQSEFTIERARERDAGAGRSSPSATSSAPQGERQAGQAEFDLGGTTGRQPESGMPERLRRKYYVADASAGDEAKVYADPRGEYLAFKVSTDRMATRLEDAGVVRDMVSIAQHRSWKEIELRGSEEFRRTAWLEASVRGISVRGYEPDPIDRAALAFKTKPDARSTRAPSRSWQREAEASETISVAGVSTKRPIDITVLPPARDIETKYREDETTQFRSPLGSDQEASRRARTAEWPSNRAAMTIDVVPFRAEASLESPRTAGRHRADAFRSDNHRENGGDDVVRAARSQFVAIERALSKAIRDPVLRRSVLAHAKERIAEQLERGREFKHAELRERTSHREPEPDSKSAPHRRHQPKAPEVHRER